MEAIEELLKGINEDNFDMCASVVAQNFPHFIDNPIVLSFPEPVIDAILNSDEIRYPNDPNIIMEFYFKIFERGPEIAQFFCDFIPLDEMNEETLIKIADKLQSLDLKTEAKRFRRVANLHKKLKEKEEQYQDTLNILNKTAEQLDKTSDYIPKASKLLDDTTKSLSLTQYELRETQRKLLESEEEVVRLKKKQLKNKKR